MSSSLDPRRRPGRYDPRAALHPPFHEDGAVEEGTPRSSLSDEEARAAQAFSMLSNSPWKPSEAPGLAHRLARRALSIAPKAEGF